MTTVGKILVIVIMLFAVLFLGISTVVFTTAVPRSSEVGVTSREPASPPPPVPVPDPVPVSCPTSIPALQAVKHIAVSAPSTTEREARGRLVVMSP